MVSTPSDPNHPATRQLRRTARPGSPTYWLSIVVYLVATTFLFDRIGEAVMPALHGGWFLAFMTLVQGVLVWWVGAGTAARLGVSPAQFFARLAALLAR